MDGGELAWLGVGCFVGFDLLQKSALSVGISFADLLLQQQGGVLRY